MTKANIPNILTISRIFLILISMLLATNDVQEAGPALSDLHSGLRYTAFALAIIAGITDLFDGYLARKWNQVSDIGALLDPIADKIFLICTSLILVQFDLMPCWILALIMSREFTVTGIRMAALRKGVLICADRWGKLKTALQMAMLCIAGIAWAIDGGDTYLLKASWFGIRLWYVWMAFMTGIVLITLFSGLGYFIRYRKLFLGSDDE